MTTILIYSVRVILVYFFTYLVTRIMTKKAAAEMTAYEMAGLMVLANVAAEPLVDKVALKSVYGSGLLVLLMLVMSKLSTINKLVNVLEHTETIVIENGKINLKELKKLNLSLNQLFGLLREQGYDKVSDVQIAILEPQGTLSVFVKPENKPVTLKDLKINPPNEPVSLPLILDGKIITDNLKYLGKTEVWLMEELRKQDINNFKEQVLLVELDSNWNVVINRK